MIPEFDIRGNLPPGIHEASWEEFVRRFGITPRRRQLILNMRRALENLKEAGCHTAYVNGSFVTSKIEPGDFDLCWETHDVDAEKLDPVFLDVEPPRVAQKIKYGGDILPNTPSMQGEETALQFFQRDRSALSKGIVKLGLRQLK